MAFSILSPSNSTLNVQLSTTLPSARPATAPSVTAPSMLSDSWQLVTAKAVSSPYVIVEAGADQSAHMGGAGDIHGDFHGAVIHYAGIDGGRESLETV